MKILIYGINYSPELTGVGKYSGEMARWLAHQGNEVRVVTAPPYYPDWKVQSGFSSWRFNQRKEENVTVIRCPVYVPKRPTAFKRLLHLASFSLSSSLAIISQLVWKPELVILVVPTLFCAPQALLLAKLSGAKSVLHVQDYEVDALFGLGLAKGNFFKNFAFTLEKWLLNAFDRVSTISSAMLLRAIQKGVNEHQLLFFPNWSEVPRFLNIPQDLELLTQLRVNHADRVLLYSGNIGEKQGLEIVIYAAERLRNRKGLVFLIIGEGAAKLRLQDLVQLKGLTNVLFAPLQPYEKLPSLLASVDCHLVVQRRGAADAVLPSKLTNILAVGGNAVITADSDTCLGMLCKEYPGIATLVEPESVDALIEGIECALTMPGRNAVAANYAKEFLDKEKILSRFLSEI